MPQHRVTAAAGQRDKVKEEGQGLAKRKTTAAAGQRDKVKEEGQGLAKRKTTAAAGLYMLCIIE